VTGILPGRRPAAEAATTDSTGRHARGQAQLDLSAVKPGLTSARPEGTTPMLRKTRKRTTETSDYVAMMTRVLYGYGARIADDPAALAHLRDLEATLKDAVNLGIFLANKGPGHYSINEQASILGVTKQAIHLRVQSGEQVHVRIEAARSAGPLIRLADVRIRRAQRLFAAGVADVTGSDRERSTG
jgi:hypothetical protein